MLPQFPINRAHWAGMSTVELDTFAQAIFKHYREAGYPYHATDDSEFLQKVKSAREYYSVDKLVHGNTIKQTMHLLAEAWSFFPHSIEVRCNDQRSPHDVFHDDELFMKAIYKRLKIGTYISDSGIRKMLGIVTGAQAVSNFRPTAAAAIYDTFCPNGGTVLDPCSGWGGRMLGAALSNNVSRYIGNEPSIRTFDGLVRLTYRLQGLPVGLSTRIHNEAFEDLELASIDPVDFVFTSPPYFDCEVYSREKTQSCVRYPSKHRWINGFLVPLMQKSCQAVKEGGYVAINLANVKTAPWLEEELIKAANGAGLVQHPTYYLELSGLNSTNKKLEPIFIFKK